MAELRQRLRFELADSLTRQAETLADLLERERFLAGQAEPQREDRALALGERSQDLLELVAADARKHLVELAGRRFVRNELAERGFAGLSDRCLQRKQVRGEAAQLANARDRQPRG